MEYSIYQAEICFKLNTSLVIQKVLLLVHSWWLKIFGDKNEANNSHSSSRNRFKYMYGMLENNNK